MIFPSGRPVALAELWRPIGLRPMGLTAPGPGAAPPKYLYHPLPAGVWMPAGVWTPLPVFGARKVELALERHQEITQ